ncbi:MAG: hypothetical protein LBM96_05770 [Methanobrevibacter sp.]|jgi:hypothetical protein|nr:hypothetical protein [Candidatus Methanoflexus mossambicus]
MNFYKLNDAGSYAPKIVKLNNLYASHNLTPQKLDNIITKIMAANYGKSLSRFLDKWSTIEKDPSTQYYWEVIGSNRKNVPLIEARNELGEVIDASSENAGKNNSLIYLVFPDAWFHVGETIVGNLNEVYPFKIKDMRSEGTNTVYAVEIMRYMPEGVPADRLLLGERFSIESSPVEAELSTESGGIRLATPMNVYNNWTTIRIDQEVTRQAMYAKINSVEIPIFDKDGKLLRTTNQMVTAVDMEVERTFDEYCCNAMVFGVSNETPKRTYNNFGKSGNPIKVSSGIFEQASAGNKEYYNYFTLDALTNNIYELCAGKLDIADRTIMITTGERGAIQFHKAVLQNMTQGWQLFTIDNYSTGVVKKVKSDLNQNSIGAGFQFTEYYAPNGVRIIIHVETMYDDPVRNKIMHPNGGVAFSYRYDIWDLGTQQTPNIQKVIDIDGVRRGYAGGVVTWFNQDNNYMTTKTDVNSTTRMTNIGAIVRDATRCVSLIPTILQGVN